MSKPLPKPYSSFFKEKVIYFWNRNYMYPPYTTFPKFRACPKRPLKSFYTGE